MAKAKIQIKGTGPGGNDINMWVIFNEDKQEWEVSKNPSPGTPETPIAGNPDCGLDDIIIEGLAAKNPCWVKVGGRWYKIC